MNLGLVQKVRSSPFAIAGGAGIFAILLMAVTGVIQQYFSGEEFYVFHYANNLPHMEAWQRYFLENGRLFESLYWTYQYEILGYSPPLEHAMSFVLLLVVAILVTMLFINVWPKKNRPSWLPYALIALFFFNWISISMVFKLSTDNSRIALIFSFFPASPYRNGLLRVRAVGSLPASSCFSSQ